MQIQMNEFTRILATAREGDARAANDLLALVYQELRKLAATRLAGEAPGQTLQATALVHEAYLRLVDVENQQRWNGRGHFFAAAAEAMRRILIERARRRHRVRHGGEVQRVDLEKVKDHLAVLDCETDDQLLALDEALQRLAMLEPQAAQVVKLRYFAGLTMEQVAEALGISIRTVNREWAYAKAWLYKAIADVNGTAG